MFAELLSSRLHTDSKHNIPGITPISATAQTLKTKRYTGFSNGGHLSRCVDTHIQIGYQSQQSNSPHFSMLTLHLGTPTRSRQRLYNPQYRVKLYNYTTSSRILSGSLYSRREQRNCTVQICLLNSYPVRTDSKHNISGITPISVLQESGGIMSVYYLIPHIESQNACLNNDSLDSHKQPICVYKLITVRMIAQDNLANLKYDKNKTDADLMNNLLLHHFLNMPTDQNRKFNHKVSINDTDHEHYEFPLSFSKYPFVVQI
ncbi:hypothetical protein J6590_057993 [Homalodisca vitripennis]|nr:hypothetical protein J6590_057993 [Homalodisca vitripennis]